MAESVYDMLGRRRCVCGMHDGAGCESEWQIFFAFCAFSTMDGLSLSLSLPQHSRAVCIKPVVLPRRFLAA